MRNVIVGTAGHVDHGKTCLIKALTGIDADRLKEEKQRGITIELGFADLQAPDGTDIGIIDVPGHEKFIRNMLAGIGGIDLVLLVVAADEGVMPQTVEHLDIMKLLNIRRGILVITKVDYTIASGCCFGNAFICFNNSISFLCAMICIKQSCQKWRTVHILQC